MVLRTDKECMYYIGYLPGPCVGGGGGGGG